MFDLNINEKAEEFYNYAKALAILQENLDRASSVSEAENRKLIRDTRKEIIEAMRTLVKQIQE